MDGCRNHRTITVYGIKKKSGRWSRQMALSRKQKKAFLTAAVTAGVYLSFRYLLPLIFPFLAAYLMALLLQPSAAFLEKRLRISFRGRMIGVPIGMIGGVELILLSIFWSVCWQQGDAFHGGAGTLFRRASRTDGGIVTARTAI